MLVVNFCVVPVNLEAVICGIGVHQTVILQLNHCALSSLIVQLLIPLSYHSPFSAQLSSAQLQQLKTNFPTRQCCSTVASKVRDTPLHLVAVNSASR